MTNLATVFCAQTAAFGGPFPRDLAPEAVQGAYDEVSEPAIDLINSARKAIPGLPPIHFDFIHNGGVNAVAFRSGANYFIGFYTGLLYMLRLVIGRMLSDPRTFQFIGNPREERGDLELLTGYTPQADLMNSLNTLVTPRRAGRRSALDHFEDRFTEGDPAESALLWATVG